MKIGQIRKLSGEYWLEIKHDELTLLFKLQVRGEVAHKAIEEVMTEVSVELQPLIGDLEEIVHWGMMASSTGNKTLDTVVGKLTKIINRYRLDDISPD